MINEGFERWSRPKQRLPVLDDTRQPDRSVYWSDPPVETDWQAVADRHLRTVSEQLATLVQLREELSATRFERDVWTPLAWCVGVICGVAVGWWLG